MEESKLYVPIGEWLIAKKGCQNNSFSRGYTIEPCLRAPNNGSPRRPDVVGVRYERIERKEPAYGFHFTFVEVKMHTEPGNLYDLIGKLKMLRHYIDNGNVAVDTVQYYAALPAGEISKDVRIWATERGVEILSVIIDETTVIIREELKPEVDDRGFKRNDVVSQQCPECSRCV